MTDFAAPHQPPGKVNDEMCERRAAHPNGHGFRRRQDQPRSTRTDAKARGDLRLSRLFAHLAVHSGLRRTPNPQSVLQKVTEVTKGWQTQKPWWRHHWASHSSALGSTIDVVKSIREAPNALDVRCWMLDVRIAAPPLRGLFVSAFLGYPGRFRCSTFGCSAAAGGFSCILRLSTSVMPSYSCRQ